MRSWHRHVSDHADRRLRLLCGVPWYLAKDVIDRAPSLGLRAAYLTQLIRDKLIEHAQYIRQHGEDIPDIREWKWGAKKKGKKASPRK